jgi:hypothetical protein
MVISESRPQSFIDLSFYEDSQLSIRPIDCGHHVFLESLNITILASLFMGNLILC